MDTIRFTGNVNILFEQICSPILSDDEQILIYKLSFRGDGGNPSTSSVTVHDYRSSVIERFKDSLHRYNRRRMQRVNLRQLLGFPLSPEKSVLLLAKRNTMDLINTQAFASIWTPGNDPNGCFIELKDPKSEESTHALHYVWILPDHLQRVESPVVPFRWYASGFLTLSNNRYRALVSYWVFKPGGGRIEQYIFLGSEATKIELSEPLPKVLIERFFRTGTIQTNLPI